MKKQFLQHFTRYTDHVVNLSSLEYYITFCLENQLNDKKDKKKLGFIEEHHILPRALFPEFKKEKWNLVKLSPKNHFMAHYYLANAMNHKKVVLSLTMMKRTFKHIPKEDVAALTALYEEHRLNIAKHVSAINTGKKHTKEFCDNVSKRTKGTAVYRDLNGNNHRLSTSDPRVLSGEFVYYRTGTKHTDTTKQKISDNGNKNKIVYTNGSDIKFFTVDETVPEGYTPGNHIAVETGKINGKKLYFYNPLTKNQIRISSGTLPPDGYIPGKIYYGKNGNPLSNVKVADNIIDGNTIFLNPDEKYPRNYANRACNTLWIYGNFMTPILKIMSDLTGYTPIFIQNVCKYPDKIVNSKTKDKLARTEMGKRLQDFGFTSLSFDEYRKNIDEYNHLEWLG